MSTRSVPSEPTRVDIVMETLSRWHRRRFLYYLREQESATCDELVDLLTGWATVDEDDVAGPTDRRQMAIKLAHVTMPKLQDAGLVRYDPATDVVELTELPDWLEGCLDVTFAAEVGRPEDSERIMAQVAGGGR